MANRWASGLLVGLGIAGLCPMAQAQGVPGEPMPINAAGGNFMPQGPAPMFGTGYGPGMPAMAPGMQGGMPSGMPGGPMMPMGGMPGMPGMGDPGMQGGMPGMPGGPSMNFGECGPNGVPGVGLPMGATYYPGISGMNRGSCWEKIFCSEDGERRKWYAKAGYIGLKRNGLPSTPMVTEELLENNIDGLGDPTLGLTPVIGTMNNVSGRLSNGVQAAIGLQDDCQGVIYEIGGFFLSNTVANRSFTSLGRLDSPYFNAPIGFQENQGLWTNADFMQLTYKNTIYSGEMNMRFFGDCWKTLDVNYLIGLRYIQLQDSLQQFTIDDDLQLGIVDPTTHATLRWGGTNNMLGGQVGWSLTQRLTPTWSVSWDQKIALLANAARTQTSLYRGDGFEGYNVNQTTWRFAQAYEGGLFLEMNAGNLRLRAGYAYNIYVGVTEAANQFTYDLEAAPFTRNSASTVIYHGPSASFEFVF